MQATEQLLDVTQRLTRCWDQRDVEGTLQYYTEDVDYSEPGAGVHIKGRDALRTYLNRYFEAWDTRWTIREHYRLEGQDALVAFWDMEVWRPGSLDRLMTKGMDLLVIRGDQIARDTVYYDRTQLKSLLKKPAA
ncbi:nuclear transport factor 2 family protein [Janthinobacterium sp. PC23-8]|uniref:nuclear transport factor 2 family protein n=1 Tax=Janthinobacterium sp. PC23-8 TaxID=2012679 RepID=UPI001594FB66|nr:nuclear transport factor 2 family protein [Janthinobacterium sp. PC23-8]